MEDVRLDELMRRCTKLMEGGISAVTLTMPRPAFGQSITPKKGSVLASPRIQHYPEPYPDYFFHWLRDSALVMDAVTSLSRNAQTSHTRRHWNRLFDDFVNFSLSLGDIKGADFVAPDYRSKVLEGCRQFLRPEVETSSLEGDALWKEPRFNPDGTPDILKWSRPQYDGAALRAITCLRHWDLTMEQKRPPSTELKTLLLQDLDFTLKHADAPGIGPWERDEEFDQHYYSSVTQLGALHHGAKWAAAQGDQKRADACQNAAARISQNLDLHWDQENEFYKATRHLDYEDPEDHLDISVMMGVVHARLPNGQHSIHDERVSKTLTALETMFARDYPINQNRPENMGPAMGRFKSDQYFSGGAYYFSTFAAAEFYYRQAKESANPDTLIRKGDAIMEMACQTIPKNGRLSEQFSKESGAQTSARDLTWSYAAFITAYDSRRQAYEHTKQLATRAHPGKEMQSVNLP